jgi:acetyl esterase/lipase
MTFEDQLDPILRDCLEAQPEDRLEKTVAGLSKDPGPARAIANARQAEMATALPKVEVLREKRTIDGPGGALDLYIFRPPGDGPRAGFVYNHGGGYVVGSGDDGVHAPAIAHRTDAVVVSPDYRLAPEHRAPAALEDSYAALLWTVAHAEELGIDPARLGVGGASAGGGLAAALALYSRDQGGPRLSFQLLLYPMLDDSHDTPSGHEVVHPKVWNRRTSLWAWSVYSDGTEYAAAARAKNLSGLPPAYVGVGQQDLFRDECIDYAQRLMAAGVPVELQVVPGMCHGGELWVPEAPLGARFRADYLDAVRRGLAEDNKSGG